MDQIVWTSETNVSPEPPRVADDRIYVICRTCGYERELGVPCGLPCV